MPRRRKLATVLIPLPLYYNPDQEGTRKPVEQKIFVKTAKEIIAKFQGGTLHIQSGGSAKGFWWDKGVIHTDVLALMEVDFPDTRANRAWFHSYAKNVLLGRFRQKAIYLKFVGPVETSVVREHKISSGKAEEESQ